MDDLTQLRQINREVEQADIHLFKPRDTIRFRPLPGAGRPSGPGKNYTIGLGAAPTFLETKNEENQVVRTFLDSGKNPPEGVVVTYFFKEKPKEDVTLAVLDAQGNEIKSFTSRPEEKEAPPETEAAIAVEGAEAGAAATEEQEEVRVRKEAGANRFIWNLRYPDARKVPEDQTAEGGIPGPHAPPGSYQVRLTAGNRSFTQSFELVKEPRVAATQADFDAQFDLHLKIRDRLSQTHDAINQIRSARGQADSWIERAKVRGNAQNVIDAAEALKKSLSAVEDELIQTKAKGQLDSINFPVKLNAKLAGLTAVVAAADFAPPQQTYEVFEHLSGLVDAQLGRLRQVFDTELAALNTLIQQSGLPGIVPEAGVKGAREAALATANKQKA
jgi:hypothetical protein